MTTMNTPEGINFYRLAVLKQAIKALQNGFQINRAYTPTAVKNAVENETGKKYKRGEYDRMLGDIKELMERLLKEAGDKGLPDPRDR